MFIQVSLHRLTKTELEIWIDGSISLVLGQVLRFEAESPLYAQLISMEGGVREGVWLAKLEVIIGTPTTPLDSATVLSDEELAREIHFFRGGEEFPFQLGRHFASDLSELGTITLIESPSVALKQQVLNIALHEIQAYQKQVLLDPVGLFASHLPDTTHLVAGKDFRLSIQKVGILRFLQVLGDCFPAPMQEEALRMISKVVPPTPDFIPLRHFLRPEKLPDLPVKTPLLHGLYDIYRQTVFADTPEEIFSLDKHLTNQVTSFDLSKIQDPWRTMVYEEICREILESASGKEHSNIVFTLVYPESYLSNLDQWIRKAYEAGLNLLIVPASYEAPTLHSAANNFLRVDCDGWAILQGSNTLGFPLRFRVRELAQKKPATAFFQAESEEFHYQEFTVPPAQVQAPVSHPPAQQPVVEEASPMGLAPAPAWVPPEMEAAPPKVVYPEPGIVSEPAEPSSVWSQPTEESFVPQTVEEPALGTSPASRIVDPEADEFAEDEDEIFRTVPVTSEPPLPRVEPSPASGSLDFSSEMFEDEEEELFLMPHIPSPVLTPEESTLHEPLVSEEEVLEESHDFSFHMEETALEVPKYEPEHQDTEAFEDESPEISESSEPVKAAPSPISLSVVQEPIIPPPAPMPEAQEEDEEEEDEQEPMQETVPVYRVHDPEQGQGEFHENDRIRHEKYGLGVIKKVHPDSLEGRLLLTVIFETRGKQIIDPALAHIEKV